MPVTFKAVDLFGGAIKANVPSDFGDVSDIRQVPDNQEVYLSTTGFTSLTIDLCERITITDTDAEALRYHFNDIVAEGDAKEIYRTTSNIELPKFPGTAVESLSAKVTPASPNGDSKARPNTPTYVVILLALVRLVKPKTDVVVALNLPNIPGQQEIVKQDESVNLEGGQLGAATEEGQSIITEVLRSLQVVDWSLFGAETE